MGSSKKHKEKRDKKKHRRSRSRSRSYEKDTRRKSHKREKEPRRNYERYDDESNIQDVRKKLEDLTKSSELDSGKIRGFEDEDDFDIEKLLDSKLSEQTSHNSKKIQDRKTRVQDFRREALAKLSSVGVSKGKQYQNDHEDSLEGFATQQLDDDERELQRNDYQKEPETNDDFSSGKAQASLSIEETNKLRAKLGLKPLDVTEQIPGLGGTDEGDSKDKKNEVFIKTENIAEMEQAKKLRERLQTMKEKRKISEKLRNVKSLGASDSDDDESAALWVIKSRKIEQEKEQAEKRAKLLEEMDAEFGIGALVEEEFDKKKKGYSSRDLRGLKVEHDLQSFKEGQRTILTLKDKGVLDEDEDTLQNVNMLDEERYAQNIENKKRKPDYQPYDEEYDEFGILQKKTLLSKYDSEIHGQKKKSFVIGTASALNKEKELEVIRMKLRQEQGISLEMPNLKVASEYFTSEDMVQFKRPKKVKKKLRRREMLKADDLIPDGDGQGDFGSRTKKKVKGEDEFLYGEGTSKVNDDNDFTMIDADVAESDKVLDEKPEVEQFALSKLQKLKTGITMTHPEKMIIESFSSFETNDSPTKDTKNPQIILNSTAEFCRTLGDIPTYGMSGNRDEDAEELMDFERELHEERERQELEMQNKGAWNAVDIDETPVEISIRENEPILEDEPDVGTGVAGALKLANKKGYLDKDDQKLLSGPRNTHLQAQSYTIEEKFYDDDKFGKRDRYTGPIQDFREKSAYKPDVKLEYIDDNGRLLNAKEAFRYLSHKFHGKGPGKNKVDKRMKKLDQDTKLKQMSSTDTPLNTVKLLQAKQKEMQSPYITLSGGSKALTQTMISKIKPT